MNIKEAEKYSLVVFIPINEFNIDSWKIGPMKWIWKKQKEIFYRR